MGGDKIRGMLMIGAAAGLVYLWVTGSLKGAIDAVQNAAAGTYRPRAQTGAAGPH